jgi:hypothetical protein
MPCHGIGAERRPMTGCSGGVQYAKAIEDN